MHEGDVAQERTHEDEARTPHDGTQRVEDQELRVGVACHARGDRDKGTHEGDETADDQRAAAVVREVVLRLLQVLGLEDAGVGLEEAAPPLGAQKVADLRTDEGRDNDEEDEGRQVQAEAVVEQASGKQQGLARQHGEQDTRLDEDDKHRSPQHPRPHGDEQSLGIFKPLDNGVQHRRIRCGHECRPGHDRALFCRECITLTLPLLTANIG